MSETHPIKKYAIVKDAVVLNTVYTEPGFIENIILNTLVDITDEVNGDEITQGYTYENNAFSAPLAAE
jgi:hypothetical protein